MSDIHANPKAFEIALADASMKQCQKVYLLGDIVGYGYDPNACIDLAMTKCDKVVLGNHDVGVLGGLPLDWFSFTACNGVVRHRKEIDDNQRKEWLRSLQYVIKEPENGFVAVHGTYVGAEDFEYMDRSWCAIADMRRIKSEAEGVRLVFCGHTHDAFSLVTNDLDRFRDVGVTTAADVFCGCEVIDVDDAFAVINIGSVGYPRALGKSVYVIYDTELNTVEFRVLPFDFKGYVNELESRGIEVPAWVDRWV